ncbi:MAG: oligopeptide:H+ symporter [Bacteroidetes bacterium]|jgi:POT family proton-dependent oligopeptide transporter|nr:oligopeptide:H+ symporter [Bacteroidota bacterium]MDF1867922.1 oligopeptide:H+ symporter [Saprospiraceae bacterium]
MNWLLIGGWIFVVVWVSIVISTNKKIHPRALFALFMVELWERFSYYGMRAILIFYMTYELVNGGLAYDDATAYGIYGAYGALVYLTPIVGGYFADKMMGFRKAIQWGAILMAAGQFTLFLNNKTLFFLGLALLVIGNGFFKPNISSMIGRFYKEGDPRRDGAFTIFYMGINMGAFLAPLTCGWVGAEYGWSFGFLAAGIGMALGYLVFLWSQSQGWFEDYGLVPEHGGTAKIAGMDSKIAPYVMTIVMVAIAWGLIIQNDIVDVLLTITGLGILGYLLFIVANKYPKEQKQRIWVIVLLLVFTTIFWTFFELAGSALNLFTERNINKTMFGMDFEASYFQSINPFFIMIFAPVFSWLWIKLANAGKEPAAPYKFTVGLLLLGAGFLVLNLGKGAAVAGLVPAVFLVMLYLLHTLGELALSPVGLSLVTKLAPKEIVGFLMGIWFLSSSIAHQAGKHIAKMTAVDPNSTVEETLELALGVFNNIGFFAIGSGVLLFLLAPMISRWMHGIK